MIKLIQRVGVIAMLNVMVAPLHAHPFHASLSMAEWNAKSGKMEIALRADPLDLERILRRLSKNRVDVESKSADKLILAYLKKSFVVKSEDGKASPIIWVGKEISAKAAWLYFEVPVSGKIEKAQFDVRLFFELERDHAHTVNLKIGKVRRSLRFKRK